MGKMKCSFGYFFFLWVHKEKGREKLIILAERNWWNFNLRGKWLFSDETEREKNRWCTVFRDLSIPFCSGIWCVSVANRMKTDRYGLLTQFNVVNTSYRWWWQNSVRFLCTVCTISRTSGKSKRTFGESVLCLLTKCEAWTIRDVISEKKSCCIYMHMHVCIHVYTAYA